MFVFSVPIVVVDTQMGISPEFLNTPADTALFLTGNFSFVHSSILLSNGFGQFERCLFKPNHLLYPRKIKGKENELIDNPYIFRYSILNIRHDMHHCRFQRLKTSVTLEN